MRRQDPERATYHVALGLRIEGDVDPDLLERALQNIVARHEPLRTRFDASNEGYAASSVDSVAFSLGRVDLRQVQPAAAERVLRGRLDELMQATGVSQNHASIRTSSRCWTSR